MRNTLFFLFAAVLGIAVSCQKEFEPQKESGTRVTVIAGTDNCKTSLVEGETSSTFKWTGTTSDYVHLYENDVQGGSPNITLTDRDTKATLSATFYKTYEGYVYKALIANDLSNNGNALLPSTQKPTATSFDPTADILIGKPTTSVSVRPETITMQFGRAIAVAKMVLTNFAGINEKVSEIVFSATNSIGGYVKPGYEEGWASYIEGANYKKITLDYNSSPLSLTNGQFNAYMLAWAVNTGSFDVKVTTDQYVYTKSVTGSVTFKLDNLVKFTFSLSDAAKVPVITSKTFTEVTDVKDLSVGAEIMILNADGTYAMSSTQNTNNRGQQAVTVTGNTVKSVSGCEIFTLGEGTLNDTYSFYATQSATKGYIFAASSSKNYLQTQATNDENSSFKVTISSGTTTLTAQGSNTRNNIKYNSSSSIFSCYSSGQTAVKLYQHDERTTPTIASTDKTITTLRSQDVSEMFTSDSDGEKSYTVSGGTLEGTTFTADEPGTYTVTLTQATSDTYKAAKATATVTVTIAPTLAAAEITATGDNTNKQITVTWTDVENATDYVLHCNSDEYEVTTGLGTTTITGLSYGTEYNIYLTANASGYYSSDSNHQSVTLDDPEQKFLDKPVILTEVSGTKVTVTWGDVSNATSYYVECGSLYTTLGTGVEIAEFTNCTAGQYDVKVTAKADGYNDGISEISQVEVYETLAAPTNLSASDITTSSIKLTWSAVDHADAGYQVSKDNSSWTDVSTTEYNFEGLSTSTEYTLYVRAKASGYYFVSDASHLSSTTLKSIVINITSSGVTGSYATKTFNIGDFTIGYTNWMKSSPSIQAKKSTTNSCYNETAITDKIKRIIIVQNQTARAVKVYGGVSKKPTTQISSPLTAATMVFDFSEFEYTYFSITTPSNVVYFSSITIEY